MIRDVFLDFFQELKTEQIPAAVLHSYQDYPERFHSDVDFVVSPDGWPKLTAIQNKVARRHGWLVAQVLQHETTARYSVLANPKNPEEFLKLDGCSDYVCNGRLQIEAHVLLENCREFRGFPVVSHQVECIYRLVKAAHKGKPAEFALPEIRKLEAQAAQEAGALFHNIIGGSTTLSEWLSRCPGQWASLMQKVTLSGRPVAFHTEFSRKLRRFAHPTGIKVSILGSDGAGKSTLISRLQEMLDPCFRNQTVFHFRPRAWERRVNSTPVLDPHAQMPRWKIVGLAKTLYYFFDHIIGHWLKVRPALVHSSLVLFDRDFSDLIVDPLRFRLTGSCTARFLSHFIPRAAVTLILDAPPEVLYARKPELTLEELSRQRQILRSIHQSTANSQLLCANGQPEEIARAAVEKIITVLAENTARRERMADAKRT